MECTAADHLIMKYSTMQLHFVIVQELLKVMKFYQLQCKKLPNLWYRMETLQSLYHYKNSVKTQMPAISRYLQVCDSCFCVSNIQEPSEPFQSGTDTILAEMKQTKNTLAEMKQINNTLAKMKQMNNILADMKQTKKTMQEMQEIMNKMAMEQSMKTLSDKVKNDAIETWVV